MHEAFRMLRIRGGEDFLGFFAVVKSEVLVDEKRSRRHVPPKCLTSSTRSPITWSISSASCFRSASS